MTRFIYTGTSIYKISLDNIKYNNYRESSFSWGTSREYSMKKINNYYGHYWTIVKIEMDYFSKSKIIKH